MIVIFRSYFTVVFNELGGSVFENAYMWDVGVSKFLLDS